MGIIERWHHKAGMLQSTHVLLWNKVFAAQWVANITRAYALLSTSLMCGFGAAQIPVYSSQHPSLACVWTAKSTGLNIHLCLFTHPRSLGLSEPLHPQKRQALTAKHPHTHVLDLFDVGGSISSKEALQGLLLCTCKRGTCVVRGWCTHSCLWLPYCS